MKCLLSLLCGGGGASVRPPVAHRPLTGLSHSGPDRPAANRRVARPLISAARMIAAVAMLAAPIAATAGHYDYYYSGPAPYQHWGPAGAGVFHGQTAGVPPPSISGAVTITFVWAKDGDFDLPPACTFVTIHCDAEADATNYPLPVYPQASASSGLPNATHTTTHPDTHTTTDRDVATYTFVQSEPGNSFTYTFSPAMSGSGNGMIFCNDVVGISAYATPVVIGFGGASGDTATGYRIIVGQKFTASPVAGTATFTNMHWWPTNPDNSPSLLYTQFEESATPPLGRADLLDPSLYGSTSLGPCYFAKPSTVKMFVAGEAILNGKFYDVEARVMLSVVAPEWAFDSTLGADGAVVINADQTVALSSSTSPQAITWRVSVSGPALFMHVGEGRWHLQQVAVPDSTINYDGDPPAHHPYNGSECLDGTLSYAPRGDVGLGFPDDGTSPDPLPNGLSDLPLVGFSSGLRSFSIADTFHMYLMYRPFDSGLGSEWVPLEVTDWTWDAGATRPNAGWSLTPVPCGSLHKTDKSWPPYPAWQFLLPLGG